MPNYPNPDAESNPYGPDSQVVLTPESVKESRDLGTILRDLLLHGEAKSGGGSPFNDVDPSVGEAMARAYGQRPTVPPPPQHYANPDALANPHAPPDEPAKTEMNAELLNQGPHKLDTSVALRDPF